MKLEGRVAIVTGAGQGIGRAIAEKLCAEGASVVVPDKNSETAAKTPAEIGGTAHVADVSDPDQVGALAAAAIDRFGKIDILVSLQSIPRRAVPADIAPAVAFLASEEAHWITGQMLTADGGHTRH